MKKFKIFDREYSDESLSDIYRDINECFDEKFNPVVNEIPTDGYFRKGTFRVEITWEEG